MADGIPLAIVPLQKAARGPAACRPYRHGEAVQTKTVPSSTVNNASSAACLLMTLARYDPGILASGRDTASASAAARSFR